MNNMAMEKLIAESFENDLKRLSHDLRHFVLVFFP